MNLANEMHRDSFMQVARFWRLIKDSAVAFVDDFAPSMGAALAYYTIFSLAPILVIVIAIAGLAFGAEAARGEILAQLEGLLGREGALVVQALLMSASHPVKSVLASVIGTATLIVGATSVFAELQDDLDRIWRSPYVTKRQPVWTLVRSRLLSFGLILAIGFLLLVSLVMSAGLAALGKWWGPTFKGWEMALQALNIIVSLVISTILFTLIYKLLPRARVAWNDVWIGAFVTAVLFTIGKSGIGLYLGTSGVTSGFGAAGSVILLLVWVYYSAQIFLLGAEFTWVYAHSHGSHAGQPPGRSEAVPTRRAEGAIVERSRLRASGTHTQPHSQ
jgi:membrane protein